MSALPATANRSGVTILSRWREERERERSGELRRAAALGPGGFVPGRPMRVGRNFSAADTGRLSASWLSSDTSINALLEAQLPIMRARARNWARNTEQGRRFCSLTRDNVAGPGGVMLQMRSGEYVRQADGSFAFQLDDMANAAIESAWDRWGRPGGGCDAAGKLSFAGMTRLVAELWGRDGEVAARRLRGADNAFRFAVQLLTVERIDHAYRAQLSNGNEVRMGVERNPAGRVVAYWVLENNPNDSALVAVNAQQRVRRPAEEMLHCFDFLDAEQLRGVPRAHAVLSGANMLHGFEESAVVAARVGASKMGFFTQAESGPGLGADALADGKDADGQLLMDAQPGTFDQLPPGYEFQAYDPSYPTEAFAPFVKARHRAMAAGLDVAHHNLSADLEGVNYSSARIGELSERDTWRGHQRQLVEQFVAPIFADWLEMALLAGAIRLPNGSALPVAKLEKFLEGATFKPRGWAWVDPLKEVNAHEKAVQNGFATRSQVVAAVGGDFDENVVELARERDLLAKHAVVLGAAPPAAPGLDPMQEDTP